VNIKERLDYSCALFDGARANRRQRAAHAGAPGLDGGERRSIIDAHGHDLRPATRSCSIPVSTGGTHLPDMTV